MKKVISVVLVVFAIAFAVAGFFVPPTGVIDASVLWFIAQCFLYSATLLGIDIEYIKLFKK